LINSSTGNSNLVNVFLVLKSYQLRNIKGTVYAATIYP
jgi:hypothetical protein